MKMILIPFMFLFLMAPSFSQEVEEDCFSITAPLLSPEVSLATLTSLMQKPFESTQEISQTLDSAGKLLKQIHDPRGLFLEIYATTISGVIGRIEKGEFKNPEWIRILLINYANIYRDALANDLSGNKDAVPPAWRVAFDASRDGKERPGSELLTAMGAHISRDLVHALLMSNTDFDSKDTKSDFLSITDTLKAEMPVLWDIMKQHGKGRGIVPAKIQELIVVGWAGNARAEAWDNARMLSGMDQEKRNHYLKKIEDKIVAESKMANRLSFIYR